MSETALAAIFRAVNQRLATSSDGWDGRVYANRPFVDAVRPYVVYQWQGGGERNRVLRQDAEIVIMVRVISSTQTEAFALAARLSALLNDMGEQDKRPDGVEALYGGAYWHILTTTQEGDLHLPEQIDSSETYHEGFFLRVKLEVRV